MCGLPSSGKTTIAKQIEEEKNIIRYSFDEIEGSNTPDGHNLAFQKFCECIRADLLSDKNVICDLIVTNSQRRRKFLSEFSDIECKKNIIVVDTSFEECLRRNEQRGDCKTDILIMKVLYLTFQHPTLDEGWDEIIYYKGE